MNSRKLLKLKNNPKLFFKDAIENKKRSFKNQFKKFLPKQSHGFSKYTIVSAVYNVEKYLDDYFKSIINQRLDFKNNIFLILIDDGSSDISAQIIKKYQKKYPKNIVYLYKENGGQASARNLGLKYMKENNYQTPWVSFTDPDDFLDRDYFYEVDKFLKENRHEDVCMVGCNVIEYINNSYRNTQCLPSNEWELNQLYVPKEIPSSFYISFSSATLFSFSKIGQLKFDEECKPHFEDGKFMAFFIFGLKASDKIVFLNKPIYFYRKTSDSTLSKILYKSNTFLKVPKIGWLQTLKESKQIYGFVPRWLQNTIIWDIFWRIQILIDKPENSRILNENEKKKAFDLLKECCKYIDTDVLLSRNFLGFYWKIGILYCLKQEKIPFRIVHFWRYDVLHNEFVFSYFTYDKNEQKQILFDNSQANITLEIDKQNMLLDNVYLYEKILYVKVPKNGKKFEIFLDGKRANIEFKGLYYRHFFFVQRFLKARS